MGLGSIFSCLSEPKARAQGSPTATAHTKPVPSLSDALTIPAAKEAENAAKQTASIKVYCPCLIQADLLPAVHSHFSMQSVGAPPTLGTGCDYPVISVKIITATHLAHHINTAASDSQLLSRLVAIRTGAGRGSAQFSASAAPSESSSRSQNPRHNSGIRSPWLSDMESFVNAKGGGPPPPWLFLEPVFGDSAALSLLHVEGGHIDVSCSSLQRLVDRELGLDEKLIELASAVTWPSLHRHPAPLSHSVKSLSFRIQSINLSTCFSVHSSTSSLEPSISLELIPMRTEMVPAPAMPQGSPFPRSLLGHESPRITVPDSPALSRPPGPFQLSGQGAAMSASAVSAQLLSSGVSTTHSSVLRALFTVDERRENSFSISDMDPKLLTQSVSKAAPGIARGWTILDSIPLMATLLVKDGVKVLCQNEASLHYWGALESLHFGGNVMLELLFKNNPTAISAMLFNVHSGAEWKGVLQVPASAFDAVLRAPLSEKMGDSNPFSSDIELGGSMAGTVRNSRLGGAYVPTTIHEYEHTNQDDNSTCSASEDKEGGHGSGDGLLYEGTKEISADYLQEEEEASYVFHEDPAPTYHPMLLGPMQSLSRRSPAVSGGSSTRWSDRSKRRTPGKNNFLLSSDFSSFPSGSSGERSSHSRSSVLLPKLYHQRSVSFRGPRSQDTEMLMQGVRGPMGIRVGASSVTGCIYDEDDVATLTRSLRISKASPTSASPTSALSFVTEPSQKVMSMLEARDRQRTSSIDHIRIGLEPIAGGDRLSADSRSLKSRFSSTSYRGGGEPAEVDKIEDNTEVPNLDLRKNSERRTPGNPFNQTCLAPDILAAPLSSTGTREDASVPSTCYHEVHAIPVFDPVTGEQTILILQTDITQRAALEGRIAALTEAQLSMLEAMFPRSVLEYMMGVHMPKGSLAALASSHEDVTIMFMDIVGFTDMSKEVSSQAVMGYLNELFTILDDLVDEHEVYKVDTSGDCYIVAGGLMTRDAQDFLTVDTDPDPQAGARKVVAFTQALMAGVTSVRYPHSGLPTVVRVGIHTGQCVSGLIGTKLPKFSLWGDTMNTASRMESTSKAGFVQISEATYKMLDTEMQGRFDPTGGVFIKGKGSMQTYLVSASAAALASLQNPAAQLRRHHRNSGVRISDGDAGSSATTMSRPHSPNQVCLPASDAGANGTPPTTLRPNMVDVSSAELLECIPESQLGQSPAPGVGRHLAARNAGGSGTVLKKIFQTIGNNDTLSTELLSSYARRRRPSSGLLIVPMPKVTTPTFHNLSHTYSLTTAASKDSNETKKDMTHSAPLIRLRISSQKPALAIGDAMPIPTASQGNSRMDGQRSLTAAASSAPEPASYLPFGWRGRTGGSAVFRSSLPGGRTSTCTSPSDAAEGLLRFRTTAYTSASHSRVSEAGEGPPLSGGTSGTLPSARRTSDATSSHRTAPDSVHENESCGPSLWQSNGRRFSIGKLSNMMKLMSSELHALEDVPASANNTQGSIFLHLSQRSSAARSNSPEPDAETGQPGGAKVGDQQDQPDSTPFFSGHSARLAAKQTNPNSPPTEDICIPHYLDSPRVTASKQGSGELVRGSPRAVPAIACAVPAIACAVPAIACAVPAIACAHLNRLASPRVSRQASPTSHRSSFEVDFL